MLPAIHTRAAVAALADHFDFDGLRTFPHVPDGHGVGIASLHGMVVVYDEGPIHREGIVEGAFYVRESQHPQACLEWEAWLRLELDDRTHRAQPRGRLRTRREVVRAIRWPRGDQWALRLSSGVTDGPYHDWAFGQDFVGKIIGIYLPSASNA